MQVSDKAIILSCVKYGDRKFMLRFYSRHHGIINASAVVSSKPSSRIRKAAIEPMNLVEIQLVKRANREVHNLSEINCYQSGVSLRSSITRLGTAQFMNEILYKTIKDHSANPALFDFIESTLRYLEESTETVNLHLFFLAGLSRFLGFEPHNNFSESNRYFDCREGQFSEAQLAYPLGLDEADSKLFSQALEMDLLKEKITYAERQRLLSSWIACFQMHVPGFEQVKSLEVLREVLSS